MIGRLLLALCLGLAFGGRVEAQACVQCSCSIETDGLAFGAYVQRQRALSVANVIVNCDGNNGYLIKLSGGNSGSPLQRTLRYGQNMLAYNVYKDPSRSLIWGDGSGGQSGVGGTGSGSYAAYGEIFANQAEPVGSYGDLLVLTIEY